MCLDTLHVDRDLKMVDKVEHGVVKTVETAVCPWDTSSLANYWWIAMQLKYTIHYQSKFVSNIIVSRLPTITWPSSRRTIS